MTACSYHLQCRIKFSSCRCRIFLRKKDSDTIDTCEPLSIKQRDVTPSMRMGDSQLGPTNASRFVWSAPGECNSASTTRLVSVTCRLEEEFLTATCTLDPVTLADTTVIFSGNHSCERAVIVTGAFRVVVRVPHSSTVC